MRTRRSSMPDDVREGRAVRRWSLRTHDVGRRDFLLAGALLVVFVFSRLVGIGEPKDSMSDEFLYTRSASDYINGKSPGEWTHPPLSKEVIALSMWALARPSVSTGVAPKTIGADAAVDGDRVSWVAGTAVVEGARIKPCGIREVRRLSLNGVPTSVSIDGSTTVVGVRDGDHGALVTIRNGAIESTESLSDVPRHVAILGGSVIWSGIRGTLGIRTAHRGSRVLAPGAGDVIAVKADHGFWVSFPDRHRIELLSDTGKLRRRLSVPARPGVLAAPVNLERGRAFHTMAAITIDVDTHRIWAVDPNFLLYVVPTHLGRGERSVSSIAPSRGGFAWWSSGREVTAGEALGVQRIHAVRTSSAVLALLSDGTSNTVTAITKHGAECISWNPLVALRLPSALSGGLLVAALFLLATALTGSSLLALAAAALLAFDGLSYTLARMGGPDYIVAALVVASWAGLVFALHASSRGSSSARRWLVAAGAMGGLATGAKWNGAWAVAGLVLLIGWDIRARRAGGLRAAFEKSRLGRYGPVFVFGAAAFVAYAVVWLVHALLVGAGLGEVLRDHAQMFAYHSSAHGFAPYESYWYQWPTGAKPVPIHIGKVGARSADLWIIGNPVVFYAGALALISATVMASRRKRMDILLPLVAAMTVYLPWIYVARTPFLYQYALVTPFLALAVAVWAANVKEKWSGVVVCLVVIAAGIGFGLLLPIMAGWALSPTYLRSVQHVLPWMFNPPQLPLVG